MSDQDNHPDLDDFYADAVEDMDDEDIWEDDDASPGQFTFLADEVYIDDDDVEYEEGEEDEDDEDEDGLYIPGEDDEDDDMEMDDDDDEEVDDEEAEGEGQTEGNIQFLELAALINSATNISAEARTNLLSRLLNGSVGGISISRGATTRSPADRSQAAARARRKEKWWKVQTEPDPKGVSLLRSGEFGAVGPWSTSGASGSGTGGRRRMRNCNFRRRAQVPPLSEPTIPNTPGTIVATYPSIPYVGQYCGPDYGTFYTATQYFTLHLYSTAKPKTSRYRHVPQTTGAETSLPSPDLPGAGVGADDDDDDDDEGGWGGWSFSRRGMAVEDTSLRKIRAIKGVEGRWTVTDADADRQGQKMIYSSITPYVHMINMSELDAEHHELNFSSRRERTGGLGFYQRDFGIWSIRFSADGKEVIAGAGDGNIMVYDIESDQRTLNVHGHDDDVNGVCFADESSTNILVSGSDDGYVKVWDRRSLSSSTPSGILAGATEGITYVSPKGDGRYVVANSKDQAARLYDLRKMRSWSEFEGEKNAAYKYGQSNFDYRDSMYRRPERSAHPKDCSVMTFRGHSVLRTLIRCHFSPAESTGQSYIYSGSADGLIHIWSLDGRVVQVLNRAESAPLRQAGSSGEYTDPSAPEPRTRGNRPARLGANAYEAYGLNWTVRDVAWHAFEPTLMSTCWEVEAQYRRGGSLAKHEWKGLGKGGLRRMEDWVEKSVAEAQA